MKSDITELELLIDKINLLYQSIKSDGQVDKIEGELFLKYVNQLQMKMKELISDQQPVKKELKSEESKLNEVVNKPVLPEIKEEHKIVQKESEKKPEVNINAFENVKIKNDVKETEKPVQEKKLKKNLVADTGDDDEGDVPGLHSKLSKDKKTLAEKISGKKSKDLISSIDLNERIYFTRHLFKGDSLAFDKAIREINALASVADANSFIEKELILKLNWKENEAISRFRELAARKFN